MAQPLRHYQVILRGNTKPLDFLAYNRSHAVITAKELYPEVPIIHHQVVEIPQW